MAWTAAATTPAPAYRVYADTGSGGLVRLTTDPVTTRTATVIVPTAARTAQTRLVVRPIRLEDEPGAGSYFNLGAGVGSAPLDLT